MTFRTDPGPGERIRLQKIGSDGGWRLRPHGVAYDALDMAPWMTLHAETATGSIALALTHDGVALRAAPAIQAALAAEGHGTPDGGHLLLPTHAAATAACIRAWHLARALPNAPEDRLAQRLAAQGLDWSGPDGQDLDPTCATTREATVRLRVGQSTFRDALMDYWSGRCPLTGITDPALLRASHIVPWAECASDAQRLDVFNGLLLSSLWDAAFDAHLVSFDETGKTLRSSKLTDEAADTLSLDGTPTLALRDEHQVYLAAHRNRFGGP